MAAVSGRQSVLVLDATRLAEATREALDFLDTSFAGKRVWVKPNLLSPHPPERSVTTDPELVRYVVRELRRRGAAEVWVADSPAGSLQRDMASQFAITGIPQASEGSFRTISDRPVMLPCNSRLLPAVPAARLITQIDMIINLPVFKTHALTILTGAVKNLYGIIPGAQKSHLHTLARTSAEFGELLVDIYQSVSVPVLTIMDALRGMDGLNGPSNGRVLRLNRLIAGRNPLAVDIAQAALAGANPLDIPVILAAVKKGMAPENTSQIEILGSSKPIEGFQLPPARLAARLTPLLARLVYPFLRRWPYTDRQSCTRCGRCAENCPVLAISLSPFPQLNRDRCIICYCCVEICPEQAVSIPGVGRSILQQLIRH